MARHRPHIRRFEDSENGKCVEIIGTDRMRRHATDLINELIEKLRREEGVEVVDSR